MIYAVINDFTGEEVCRYAAVAPTEASGFGFDGYTHHEVPEEAPASPVNPERWRVYVGAFFDRFGPAKIAILADTDPLVQAVIKDASVRKYIDLLGRRDELVQVIGLLQSKGHAVDVAAVVDAEPMASEVWNG